MTAPELKPCPFCGGEVTLDKRSKLGVFVCQEGSPCRDTNMHTTIFLEDQEAGIAAWNTRAPDPDLEAAVNEALERAAVKANQCWRDGYDAAPHIRAMKKETGK